MHPGGGRRFPAAPFSVGGRRGAFEPWRILRWSNVQFPTQLRDRRLAPYGREATRVRDLEDGLIGVLWRGQPGDTNCTAAGLVVASDTGSQAAEAADRHRALLAESFGHGPPGVFKSSERHGPAPARPYARKSATVRTRFDFVSKSGA